MLDILLGFKTYSNLLAFIFLVAASSLWIYRGLKKHGRFSLAPFILVSAGLFLLWGVSSAIDMDETEHLHCSWMVAGGLIPFCDFWQHHSPFLWIILAPIFKLVKPAASIFNSARLFSLFLFTAIILAGWRISRKVWREEARLSLYLLLIFGASIWGQFLYIRPDLFSSLLLLLGLYFSLEMAGPKLSPALFTGIAFGLAASFTFKQYLLFFLPVIIAISKRDKISILKIFTYLAGLLLGGVPLVFYLIKKGILKEFIYWVFNFNGEKIIVSASFPIAIFILGTGSAYLLFKRYLKSRDSRALILFSVFCLSALSSLTSPINVSGGYYMGFWFILCAILSSGCRIMEVAESIPSLAKRSVILGLLFAFLIAPNLLTVAGYTKIHFYEDKKVISKLMGYAGSNSCFLILPLHPVFNRDATRLYSDWQYYFTVRHWKVKKDAKSEDIAGAVMNSRPAVILYRYNGRLFLFDLFLKDLISQEDLNKLMAFFKADYTVKRIGEEKYYIRNDRLKFVKDTVHY